MAHEKADSAVTGSALFSSSLSFLTSTSPPPPQKKKINRVPAVAQGPRRQPLPLQRLRDAVPEVAERGSVALRRENGCCCCCCGGGGDCGCGEGEGRRGRRRCCCRRRCRRSGAGAGSCRLRPRRRAAAAGRGGEGEEKDEDEAAAAAEEEAAAREEEEGRGSFSSSCEKGQCDEKDVGGAEKDDEKEGFGETLSFPFLLFLSLDLFYHPRTKHDSFSFFFTHLSFSCIGKKLSAC